VNEKRPILPGPESLDVSDVEIVHEFMGSSCVNMLNNSYVKSAIFAMQFSWKRCKIWQKLRFFTVRKLHIGPKFIEQAWKVTPMYCVCYGTEWARHML